MRCAGESVVSNWGGGGWRELCTPGSMTSGQAGLKLIRKAHLPNEPQAQNYLLCLEKEKRKRKIGLFKYKTPEGNPRPGNLSSSLIKQDPNTPQPAPRPRI